VGKLGHEKKLALMNLGIQERKQEGKKVDFFFIWRQQRRELSP